MNEHLKTYITAISAALFLVVAASGLAMFFHVGEDLVKEMHQWLALVFVTAIALHVYRNWGAMMTYVRRRTIVAPLALAAVAAAVFMVPAALSGRDDPRHALMQSLQEAKLADLGRVLDVPADSLVARLEKDGFTVASTEQRLSEIASGSGKPPMAALMTAVGAGPR
jgi:Domain of unknown function (DUF4405)